MNTPGLLDLWIVIPLVIMFLTSIFPVTIKIMTKNQEQPFINTITQCCIGLILALVFWLFLGSGQTGFSDKIVIDNLAYIIFIVVIIFTIAVLFISYGNLDVRSDKFSEHVFLIINASIGIIVVFISNDFMISFIGIELMSLAFYVLIGLSLEERLSKEASIKYFILGSVGSAILLYGIALLYGSTGSFAISDIKDSLFLIKEDPVFLMGFVLLTAGLLFKSSVFPFHAWVPDVYQGAPTPVTAYMSTLGKIAGVVFLMKIFMLGLLKETSSYVDILQWLSVITMLVGNFCALKQESLKRMLAYSSIAHSGYILIGIICLGFDSSNEGAIVMFYLIAYSLMNFGAFALVNLLERRSSDVILLDNLKCLSKKPLHAAALSICLLSLAGLPPTMGFFGKFYLFTAAINKGLFWLVLWAIISTMISMYYYLRPVLIMYMPSTDHKLSMNQNVLSTAVLLTSALIIMIGGIFSEKIVALLLTYIPNM